MGKEETNQQPTEGQATTEKQTTSEQEKSTSELLPKNGLLRNESDYRTLFILSWTWVIFCVHWFFIYEIENKSKIA